MFVLVHKQRVTVGPMGWNRAMFDLGLTRLNINRALPTQEPKETITIDADTKICAATLVYPEHNKKITYLHGPFWDYTDPDLAVGTFEILDIDPFFVKQNLKQQVAEYRWKKEIAGTKTTIQNTEITIDTARENRDVFFQKYQLMGENDTTVWKFPEAWLTLTKAELGQVIMAGALYVESCFVWEKDKAAEIDACTTNTELDAVVLVMPGDEQSGNQPFPA